MQTPAHLVLFVVQQVADEAYGADAILNDNAAAGGGPKGGSVLS